MNCKLCKFYFSNCDTPNCRRFPPVHNDNLRFGIFPAVHEYDWCGEYLPSPARTQLETGAANADSESKPAPKRVI